MKIIFLLFLLSLKSFFVSLAQETSIDSTVVKMILVKKDIRHFYLNKQDWKTCKKQHFKYTSDYFKPNKTNVTNPDLLEDSVYVKAYRIAALKKIKHKRTILKIELIGGIALGALTTAMVVIILPSILRFN